MTRKDYVKLADSLRGSTPVFSIGTPDAVACARVAQQRTVIKAIADVLAGDNGRFDRGRFYRAAWYEANSDIVAVES
jgi:hypothetical protein